MSMSTPVRAATASRPCHHAASAAGQRERLDHSVALEVNEGRGPTGADRVDHRVTIGVVPRVDGAGAVDEASTRPSGCHDDQTRANVTLVRLDAHPRSVVDDGRDLDASAHGRGQSRQNRRGVGLGERGDVGVPCA